MEEKIDIHEGCCHHPIEKNEEDHKYFLHKHILHPLVHSLKIFAYVLVLNLIFGILIFYIGENAIGEFLQQNLYLTPLFAAFIGLIPNCVSSVIITKMFLIGSLSIGATITGLICNAGLGLIFLFKNKKNIKNNFIILGILFATSLLVGYLTLFIEQIIH